MKGLTNTNFNLTQDNGTALTGTPSFTTAIETGTGSPSRHTTTSESGTFSYTWQVTTAAIADGEEPRLTIANITGIDPEGSEVLLSHNPLAPMLPTRNHRFLATAPTITNEQCNYR